MVPLLVVTSVALMASLAALLLPPIPLSKSVQATSFLEPLWTTPLYKQITGFSVVGLFALGGCLSLRKRISWLNFGSFASWRLVHVLLGIVALSGLFLHTGFRLGKNIDLWLGLFFLVSSVLGAATGLVVSLEARMPANRAAWLRRVATRLHLWLLWPVPALIVFHVIKAYYF
jgi:nitrite reductase (NADH) large subunit